MALPMPCRWRNRFRAGQPCVSPSLLTLASPSPTYPPSAGGHSGRPYPVHPCTQPREGEPWRAALCAGQCAMHPEPCSGLAEGGGAPLWGSKLPEGI